uniref:Uncharacterized protein n=1 Tax=Panagrolaimus davidi TaxID=227884 RepID=A0A914R931_9BILA
MLKLTLKTSLSVKSFGFTENLLENVNKDIKTNDLQKAWNIIGKVSSDLTDVSIGQCLPQEIVRISSFKFYVVSAAFAEITKDLIDVSIAAIYCADEIANGDSKIRATLIKKVQSQLREIYSVSKTYVKFLLEDFLVYQTLTGILRLHFEKHYGESRISTENYNKTAEDIRHYLDIRGYGL